MFPSFLILERKRGDAMYVIGLEEEWGQFVLSRLEAASGPLGLAIERTCTFSPARSSRSKVIVQYRTERGH